LLSKYSTLNQIPFNSAPIGTGPYKFARWLRGDRIVLTANPDYFRGAPHIKTLTLLYIPDDNTTVAELRTHEVELALQMSLTGYKDMADDTEVVRQPAAAPTYTAVMFNSQRAPLNDVRVRRALVLGADRPAIVRDDTYGTGTLASADLSPFSWAFDPSIKPIPFDLAQAKSLLDSAGWVPGADGVRVKNGNRLSLQLVFGQGSQLVRTISQQLQQMYKPLGIDVQLKTYDYAVLYATAQNGGILNGGKFDLAMYSWIAGGDPDNASQWTCAQIPPNGNNIGRYCSPEMDADQKEALATFDVSKRKAAYAKIERLLLSDAPAAFLYYSSLRYVRIPQLQNFAPNGISEGWNAQDWTR
jgi:peptide/nickel transport system substrate-binding protein